MVGPGTPGALNGDGTLANWDTLVANKIISADAWLYVGLPVSLGDTGLTITGADIYINGNQVANVVFNQPTQCVFLKGATKYLKFAPLVPGQPQPNCSANPSACSAFANGIGFVVGAKQEDLNADPVTIGMGTLTFKAMAPIVMVHGWNSGPEVWEASSASPKVCPSNGTIVTDFVQPLKDAQAPFDCSIKIAKQASIDVGAGSLGDQLAGVLKSFGVRHVNLVAHSKGGLYAREFLADTASSDSTTEIGVISLTTLDTPHAGSVLADSIVNFDKTFVGGIAQQFVSLLGPGAKDLTQDKVEAFDTNPAYSVPPSEFDLTDTNGNSFKTVASYYSTSADADQNGDGKIESAEATPYSRVQAQVLYQIVAGGQAASGLQFVTLFSFNLLRSTTTAPAGGFQNDCLVSTASAGYPSFDQINSYIGNSCPATTGCGRNHSTIRSPDVASLVLQKIMDAEKKNSDQSGQ